MLLVADRLTVTQVTLHDPSSSVPANADSLPSGVLVRNGVDTAVVVTVAKTAASTGRYTASVTIPDDAVAGEEFKIRVAATVGGVSDVDYVLTGVVGYTPDDVADATRTAFASVSFTVSGSLDAEGTLSIVQGDDYYAADGRALSWTITGSQPDYTGATARLKIASSGERKTIVGTIPTETGATRVVRFELSSTDTALPDGNGSYEIEITLATSGHVLTPVFGVVQIRKQIG